jgi:multimeric flavodoxin WrbA
MNVIKNDDMKMLYLKIAEADVIVFLAQFLQMELQVR